MAVQTINGTTDGDYITLDAIASEFNPEPVSNGGYNVSLLTGIDRVEINGMAGPSSVVAQDGGDVYYLSNNTGAVSLTLGNGTQKPPTENYYNNVVEVSNSKYDYTTDTNILTSGGPVTITGGNGNDQVQAYELGGAFTANLGDGADDVIIMNMHTTDPLAVDLGAGNDSVSVVGLHNPDTYETIFSKMSINGGTGIDSVWLHDVGDGTNIKMLDGGDVVEVNDMQGTTSIILGDAATPITLSATNEAPFQDIAGEIYGWNNSTLPISGRVDNIVRAGIFSSDSWNMPSVPRSDISVTGGNGNDVVIASMNGNVNIDSGAGDDWLDIASGATSSTATIDAGAGNDSIQVSGMGVNADLGTGADKLIIETWQGGSDINVKVADGGDLIRLMGPSVGEGPIKVSIGLGSGGGTVDQKWNAGIYGSTSGRSFNNVVDFWGAPENSMAVVGGGSDADLIVVKDFTNASVNGGNGDDLIDIQHWNYNQTPDNAVVDGGSGNDTIYVDGYTSAKINGGAGDDYISGTGTINGGDGNDKITINGSGLATGGAGFDIVTSTSYEPTTTVEGGVDGSTKVAVTVGLRSTLVNGVGALASLYVDGVKAGSAQVDNTTVKDYTFTFDSSLISAGKIDIQWGNDAYIAATSTTPAQDRNLYVASGSIRVSDSAALGFQALDASKAIYDRGAGTAAFDGKDIYTAWKQSDGTYGLGWSGALRFQLATPEALKGDELHCENFATGLFKRGDGIENYYGNATIQTGSDIAFDQLWFSKNKDGNVVVSVIGTSDKAIGHDGAIDSIHDKSGKTLDYIGLDELINAMASMTPPPMGQTTLTADQHAKLDAVLAANWH